MAQQHPLVERLFRQGPTEARETFALAKKNDRLGAWVSLSPPAKIRLVERLKLGDTPPFDGQSEVYGKTKTDAIFEEMGIGRDVNRILIQLVDKEANEKMPKPFRTTSVHQSELKEGVQYMMDIDIDGDNPIRRSDIDSSPDDTEPNAAPENAGGHDPEDEERNYTRRKTEPPFLTLVKVTKLRVTTNEGGDLDDATITFIDGETGARVRVTDGAALTIYNYDDFLANQAKGVTGMKAEMAVALEGVGPTGKRVPPDVAGLISKFALGKGRRTRRAKKSRSMRKKRTVSKTRK